MLNRGLESIGIWIFEDFEQFGVDVILKGIDVFFNAGDGLLNVSCSRDGYEEKDGKDSKWMHLYKFKGL